jgi:tRNA A37 methylthiotransferase MiaB
MESVLKRKFHVVDCCCWRRQEDRRLVEEFLLENAYGRANDIHDANLVVFSACGLTQQKSEEMILKISDVKAGLKKNATLVVGGCLPKIDREKLQDVFHGEVICPTDLRALNKLPGVEISIEDFIKSKIKSPNCFLTSFIDNDFAGQGKAGNKDSVFPKKKLSTQVCGKLLARLGAHGSGSFIAKEIRIIFRRVFLRYDYWALNLMRCYNIHIAKGCDRNCSYCAIRFAIGPLQSRPLPEIMDEFGRALDEGNRTFHFYADCVGDYGLDIGTSLGELLKKVAAVDRKFTLWLCDIQPEMFLKYFEEIENLCKQSKIRALHIPIQAINRRILELMRRPFDVQEFKNKILRLKKHSILFKFDLIVGFPSESEEEFQDTIEFLKGMKKVYCFVEPYSDRPKTAASGYPNKIGIDIKNKRVDKIKKLKNVIIIA